MGSRQGWNLPAQRQAQPPFLRWVLLAVAHGDTLLFSLTTLLSSQLFEGFWRKTNFLKPTLPHENEIFVL